MSSTFLVVSIAGFVVSWVALCGTMVLTAVRGGAISNGQLLFILTLAVGWPVAYSVAMASLSGFRSIIILQADASTRVFVEYLPTAAPVGYKVLVWWCDLLSASFPYVVLGVVLWKYSK